MRYHSFTDSEKFPVVLLCKPTAFQKHALQTNYVEPLQQHGVTDPVLAVTLEMGEKGKPKAAEIKAYLEALLPDLKGMGTKILYVIDGDYFKALAKKPKADPFLGYVLPCAIKGFEDMHVVYGVNYQQLVFNPQLQDKLTRSLVALASHSQGVYQDPGQNIIHSASYPLDINQIKEALENLHQYPSLACDIEAFSLRFEKAGIGTITFCWDEHNGIAFPVDYFQLPEKSEEGAYGKQINNKPVKELLRQFFESYKGNLTFHKASYDVKVIIYNLWMNGLLDQAGLLRGLEAMTRSLDDTLIIAYLAYNSTAGNKLGLKALAHEFAGNWAVEEIKDISRIALPELLQYNLVDGLSTHYVKKRDYPIMVQDNQEALYQGLMKDSLKLIIQLELTGMPMDMSMVQKAKQELEKLDAGYLDTLTNSPIVHSFNQWLQVEAMKKANAKLKTKQHPLEKFKDVVFNPNSGPQLQVLLYEQLGLPVIDLTETKLPATGGETLEKLLNHANDPQVKDLIKALIGHAGVAKILSAFIPSFEQAVLKPDGRNYLHGCFNIGGTVSGRLSSSDPNMQQIPSGSDFGKLIKECFSAPPGWIFCGADFNSLEDYISALTTKDPNKLNVYIKGFDGHCLRAAYYFRDELPHIDLNDPKSVNTIKKSNPELRQDSKAPTFLLTYGGTYHGMMSNLGWPEDKAKAIEANYHELYKVSDQYVQTRLEQASKDGFVEVAFGLRVRTPLLKQVMWGKGRVPYEAQAEGRTAGNALGQSYGLLNNRAATAFMKKVWASEFKHDILPVALIHDAIYLLIRDDIRVVEWANKHLIDEMRWQELPEIQHPTVKLGAALDLFYPSWAHPITLPNDATAAQIMECCKKELEDRKKK